MNEEIVAASSTFPFAPTDEENDTYLQTQLDNIHNKSWGNGDQDERKGMWRKLMKIYIQSLQLLFDPDWLPYDEPLVYSNNANSEDSI